MARRGFTVIEILIGVLLLSFVALTVMAGGRWLLLSVTRTTRWFTARDRGRRVIAFVEPRLLHAGLGMSKFRGALSHAFGDSSAVPAIAGWPDSRRCVTVYRERESGKLYAVDEESGVFKGTAFSVIYARSSGIIVSARGKKAVTLTQGQEARFDIITGKWDESKFCALQRRNLFSWAIPPLVGTPLLITGRSGTVLTLSLAAAASYIDEIEIPPVTELLSLRCERFCVKDGVFRFQGMEENWTPDAFYPREDGVLALWVEWRPSSRVFDMWVLTSGGPSVFAPSARPAEWPDDAPWSVDFAGHELCVSRASWRLENV